MRGPKTKPNEIKKAQGTLRPCRVKPNIIQATIELSTDAPDELNEWGARLYVQIMEEYNKIGLVSKLDTGSLLMLCNEFGTYCEADDIVKAKGIEVRVDLLDKDGDPTGRFKFEPNPMLKARNDAFKNYKAMCTEFGLTPSSRATLSVPQKPESDPIGDLLN